MTKSWLVKIIGWALIISAQAQFSPALLQNDSYWADGKAEFNIYGAELVREGSTRSCEVLHILMREKLESVPVLKLNQILSIPMGLIVQQQMHSNYWRVDNGQLLKFCLTSNDSIGNCYKEVRTEGDHFRYEYRSSLDGIASGEDNVTSPENGHFYDELPWLVRTLDFSKPSTEFELPLAGTAINQKKDSCAFQPAKISFTTSERTIEVAVKHAGGIDRFTLDRDGPHLLREWKAADGSRLKMKRNLKVDYWNYTKPGDRERALNNPMLRLPD